MLDTLGLREGRAARAFEIGVMWILQVFMDGTSCSPEGSSRATPASCTEGISGSAFERRGNTVIRLEHFYLKAKARIWPWLSYMCFVRSKAGSGDGVEFRSWRLGCEV